MSAITMSAAAVRPVVARANVARRYVPHANVARGAADRFRRRASHRDRDRNARVCFRGDGSAARAGRSGPGARARADALTSVVKRYTFRPSPTPARVSRLARSKRAVHRSSAALDSIHRGRLSASSACETRGTRAARVRSSPRLADRPTPSFLAPQLYPRGRPRRQEPLRPCVRTTPARPPQFKATLIVSLRRGRATWQSRVFASRRVVSAKRLTTDAFLSRARSVRRRRSVNAQFAAPAVKAQKARAMTTTASALPLAEIASVGPEIAEVAVTCFAITLVGLAIGFVLLRVESAVEGE